MAPAVAVIGVWSFSPSQSNFLSQLFSAQVLASPVLLRDLPCTADFFALLRQSPPIILLRPASPPLLNHLPPAFLVLYSRSLKSLISHSTPSSRLFQDPHSTQFRKGPVTLPLPFPSLPPSRVSHGVYSLGPGLCTWPPRALWNTLHFAVRLRLLVGLPDLHAIPCSEFAWICRRRKLQQPKCLTACRPSTFRTSVNSNSSTHPV